MVDFKNMTPEGYQKRKKNRFFEAILKSEDSRDKKILEFHLLRPHSPDATQAQGKHLPFYPGRKKRNDVLSLTVGDLPNVILPIKVKDPIQTFALVFRLFFVAIITTTITAAIVVVVATTTACSLRVLRPPTSHMSRPHVGSHQLWVKPIVAEHGQCVKLAGRKSRRRRRKCLCL